MNLSPKNKFNSGMVGQNMYVGMWIYQHTINRIPTNIATKFANRDRHHRSKQVVGTCPWQFRGNSPKLEGQMLCKRLYYHVQNRKIITHE